MEKIKKILFVNRQGLENKWWHRFAKVFIYGTTVLIFIILVVSTILNFRPQNLSSYLSEKEMNQDIQALRTQGASNGIIYGFKNSYKKVTTTTHDDGSYFLKKSNSFTNIKNLTSRLALDILIAISYFIICESIIYRSIIYIIYGKNK